MYSDLFKVWGDSGVVIYMYLPFLNQPRVHQYFVGDFNVQQRTFNATCEGYIDCVLSMLFPLSGFYLRSNPRLHEETRTERACRAGFAMLHSK